MLMLKSLLRLTRPLAPLALLAAALGSTLPARADGLSDLESFLRQALVNKYAKQFA
jgi:hypothetical protein